MTYLGDFAEDATVLRFFNTVDTSGAPVTIGGTAAAEVYKDGSVTQITAGVTITEDFDGITGLHLLTIDMSADAAYTTAADYAAVISVGTADSVSIVGGVLSQWSCENRQTTLRDASITTNTFDTGVFATDSELATAVRDAVLADFAAVPNAVVKAAGIVLTIDGTPTTTSIPVSDATDLSGTQLTNALVVHLGSGAASRITSVSGSAPALTLTVSPALPAAPEAADELVVFGKYLASL